LQNEHAAGREIGLQMDLEKWYKTEILVNAFLISQNMIFSGSK